jgi:hypothetical protein
MKMSIELLLSFHHSAFIIHHSLLLTPLAAGGSIFC